MCIKTFWGWREDFQWRHPTRKYKQRRGEERRGSQERLVSRKLSQTHWTQIALCEHRTQVSCYTGMHCMPCSVPDSIYNVYNVQMYISTTVAQTCREAETSPSTLQMMGRPPKNQIGTKSPMRSNGIQIVGTIEWETNSGQNLSWEQ